MVSRAIGPDITDKIVTQKSEIWQDLARSCGPRFQDFTWTPPRSWILPDLAEILGFQDLAEILPRSWGSGEMDPDLCSDPAGSFQDFTGFHRITQDYTGLHRIIMDFNVFDHILSRATPRSL